MGFNTFSEKNVFDTLHYSVQTHSNIPYYQFPHTELEIYNIIVKFLLIFVYLRYSFSYVLYMLRTGIPWASTHLPEKMCLMHCIIQYVHIALSLSSLLFHLYFSDIHDGDGTC